MTPAHDSNLPPGPEIDAGLDGDAIREAGWQPLGRLGRGATSRVIAVRRATDGVERALKLQRLHGADIALRLRREGRLQGELAHPGLLAVHEVIEVHGRVGLIMDRVHGGTLRDLVRREGPLEPGRVGRLLGPVLRGLDQAHRMGVIHRDLKASNVLVEEEGGGARLGDFGIARVLGEPEEEAATRVGQTLGTPGFMPPEQWADASRVDLRADVFSAGALTWFCLTGRAPFEGPDPTSVLRATLEGRVERLATASPGCPAELDEVVHACLDPDPAGRPDSLAPLLAVLEELAAQAPSEPRESQSRPPAREAAGSELPAARGLLVGLGAAVVLLLAGLWGLEPAPAQEVADPVEDAVIDAVEGTPEALAWEPGAEEALDGAGGGTTGSRRRSPPRVTAVPGCVATEGELIGWWSAGERLRRGLLGGVKVDQETPVRAKPPEGGKLAPVRCTLPAGAKVAVRADPLEVDGELWVPLYGGDLKKR